MSEKHLCVWGPPQDDEGKETHSSSEQANVEEKCLGLFSRLPNSPAILEQNLLARDRHIQYLLGGLGELHPAFKSLDASRPWLVYWVIHSLRLLSYDLPPQLANNVVEFLRRCQHPEGGFGGGPGQQAHLAPTYAAVCALCTIGTEAALSVINRESLYHFLLKAKQPSGGFAVAEGGEVDTRGAFCALAVASMTNLLTAQLVHGCAEWLASCQTYEGGMGGEPGNEAHGGYTFCAVAAMILIDEGDRIDKHALLHWAAQRQMSLEGGFQGRTNKLVDGCYSFWVGGLFPLLTHLFKNGKAAKAFNPFALKLYLFICCQMTTGGLRDKPGKHPDYYHSCYCLSGLSVAQEYDGEEKTASIPAFKMDMEQDVPAASSSGLAHPQSRIRNTNPLYNIEAERATKALEFFAKLPRFK